MADERVIMQADLTKIASNLNAIHEDLNVIDREVGSVNNNVKVVYDEIGALAAEFHDFVTAQQRVNRLQQAETRLVQIRQELKDKYGHYDVVRRSATGILQADDLEIVRRETISNLTEELMITTPGYWLAPCLVALAAWINDQPELAERALKEGIRRNDEKTSLFFALICRRADRKRASLRWTQRYLANQDPENLDRNSIIILDAFASGLLGHDSEGVISKQLDKWMTHLESQPGFTEQQKSQWSDAIKLKRKPIDASSYPYLRKYSHTWPVLEDILEGAYLHAEMLGYLQGIFSQTVSTASLKEQLDEILDSLVTDFDDEELPLRKKEKFEQFIVDFNGDEKRARQNMMVEESAFEEHKDFTQLLTDAAMKPESSHASVSTQKFAFALSKDWVTDAYKDVVAENRSKIPAQIEINVDTFNGVTTDGSNEEELVSQFNALVNAEKAAALAKCVLSMFEQFCLFGGVAIAVIGVVMMVMGSTFLGLIAIIAGAGLVLNHFSKKKRVDANRQSIENQYELKRNNGIQIIRAIIAEVVDFRAEFAGEDSKSKDVLDFLAGIRPEQYINMLPGSTRKVSL
ncbi:MAG: hypothetical protein IJH43_02495 [Mogibacterium sp.]|nr:hypothetical protein [Mogibacterium sp.]